MADYELGRFIRYQEAEARRLGFPTMATFARDIARGTLGVAPPTEADPIMDRVGEWYHGLRQVDRRVLADKYVSGLTEYQRAKAIGVSSRKLRGWLGRLLWACKHWLEAGGF